LFKRRIDAVPAQRGKDVKSDKNYLTPAQVSEILIASSASVRSWAAKGVLPAITTVGGHRRFLKNDVEAFAKERGIAFTTQPSGLMRLLIVDDDVQLGGYLVELLGELPGIEAIKATSDGFEAGQQVHTFKPTVILLDLMMPGMDGFEVCSRLKSNSDTQYIRVIGMTGYMSNENINKIKAAGAECCLAKPIDRVGLLSALGLPILSLDMN
jgi:excisionase family DNA binding protein